MVLSVPDIFTNTTGYVIPVLLDLQTLLMCVKASKNEAWSAADLEIANKAKQAAISMRLTIVLRSNSILNIHTHLSPP